MGVDESHVTDIKLEEPLLTASEVAALLGVARSSVYEYARRHHEPLPSIEIGRHRRFYRADIEYWLATRRSGVTNLSAAA